VARPTTAPPGRTAQAVAAPVDVRGWLGGIRLSGFMVIMLGLAVLAAFVLMPTLGTYLNQRQQITALEHTAAVTEQQVKDLHREQARWKDPAFIATAARERLFYVKPGEVVYLVDDDLPAGRRPAEVAPISGSVVQTATDWMSQLVRSVTAAGMSVVADPRGR